MSTKARTDYYKTSQDFNWYKHFPAEFATTTSHLSHVETGVYRRLLDHYWSSDNKLPRAVAQIAERIGEKVINWHRYGTNAPAGFDNEEVTFRIVEHLLHEFFEQDEDGDWRHIWLDEYREASDAQFQERSKASKARVARQSRGENGKFGKIVTVTDGESPCDTGEDTVADGKVTVEQSRAQSDQMDQIKGNKGSKASDAVSTLPEEPSGTQDEKPLGEKSPENALGQNAPPNASDPYATDPNNQIYEAA